MASTSEAVHFAIERGAKYFKRCISHQYNPADAFVGIASANPIPGDFAAYGGDVGGPPLCLALPLVGGEIDKGPWEERGPGGVGYYPLRIKGAVLFSHTNRTPHCTITGKGDQTGVKTDGSVTFNYYQTTSPTVLK